MGSLYAQQQPHPASQNKTWAQNLLVSTTFAHVAHSLAIYFLAGTWLYVRRLQTQLCKQVCQDAIWTPEVCGAGWPAGALWHVVQLQHMHFEELKPVVATVHVPVWNHIWLVESAVEVVLSFLFLFNFLHNFRKYSQKTLSFKLNNKLYAASCLFMKFNVFTPSSVEPFSSSGASQDCGEGPGWVPHM